MELKRDGTDEAPAAPPKSAPVMSFDAPLGTLLLVCGVEKITIEGREDGPEAR